MRVALDRLMGDVEPAAGQPASSARAASQEKPAQVAA
jgi:hypothetical protein